jgi:hypothetical protein
MKRLTGWVRAEGLLGADLSVEQRLHALLIGLGEDRRHDEGGQEQRERDQHRIRRALLQADGGAQQRQDHHNPHKARGHDQDGRRQAQHGEQRDQLQHPLGQGHVGPAQ